MFATAAERNAVNGPNVKDLHAKIGQLAMENDFLAISTGATASGSIPNPGDFPTENIGLTFSLTEGGSSASYTLDTVRMSERDPSR